MVQSRFLLNYISVISSYYVHKQIRSKVPILLYFVGPKRPSGNCYVSCFLTDKTALAELCIYLNFKTSLVIELWNAKLLIVVEVNKKDDSFQEKIISSLWQQHVRPMLQIFFDAPLEVSSLLF